MKILITGATGFIGQELGKALVRKGHEIYALSRSAKKAQQQLSYPAQVIEGDLNREPLRVDLLQGVQVVINLAGENVGESRWTAERKEKIRHSRTVAVDNLIQSLPPSVQVLISSSAVGIYGNQGAQELDENSPAGQGFLAEVCQQWEASARKVSQSLPNSRLVLFRTGVVFGPFGGALMKMLTPFRVNMGGVLGGGGQWMSWIHLQDLVNLYVKAVEDSSFSGVYNAVSPEPVINRQFTQELVQALHVHQGPPVPPFALKLLYGEMSQVILDSQKVRSLKLKDFPFQFPTLKKALQDCAAPYKGGDDIFYAEQFLNLPRPKVFSFFAKAENLESITPPLLNFRIESKSTEKIQKGTKILYKLKIRGVPVQWETLIEEWQPNEMFVDNQLRGPYQKWHHTHIFETLGTGTLMKDLVRYRMPLGPLGKVASPLVRKDIESIFQFRRENVGRLI